MSDYVIGDLHGSFRTFKALLKKIDFNPNKDRIYLVGDLINRGEDSVGTLSYIMEHPTSILPLLGNHDLSFLAYSEGAIPLSPRDTYDELLNHPKAGEMIHYLRQQPLMRLLPNYRVALVHGAIPPHFSIEKSYRLSQEVEAALRSDELYPLFIKHLFGNEPKIWSDQLRGFDRLRYIVNGLTRMRYVTLPHYLPIYERYEGEKIEWFTARTMNQMEDHYRLIFGHWAALGLHQTSKVLCLDSGAVWGDRLTAVELSERAPFKAWRLIEQEALESPLPITQK